MRTTIFFSRIARFCVFALIAMAMLPLLSFRSTAVIHAQPSADLTWNFEAGDVGDWQASGQVQVVSDQIDQLTDESMHTVAQGQSSLMVGDPVPWMYAGSQFSSIERTILVPQIASPVLQFSYAVVANDPPSHPDSEKPAFELQVRDQTTQEVLPVSDSKYTSQTSQEWFLGQPPADQSFSQSSFGQISGDRWVFIPWKNEKLDLRGRQGHEILVKFTVRDCNPQAHAAYGYIDNIYVGADAPAPALPALVKQPQPAGVPLSPGLLARVLNPVEQYALWPWCLLPLLLLLLGVPAYLFWRGRIIPVTESGPAGQPRPRPPEPRVSLPPKNVGTAASWRDTEDNKPDKKKGR